MQTTLRILDRDYAIDCAECDRRRLEDLARALEARLKGFGGETPLDRRLVLAALSLLDEAQATGAALALARQEIERLTDMVVDAQLGSQDAAPGLDGERGRVDALRGGA